MSRQLAYAQLVRLPNVPSAVADIALGALAVGALPGRWLPFLCLCLASACLYMAGMVFNDYFDVEEDRRERPERPIPSGRVSLAEARRLGWLLILGGVGFAFLASWLLTGEEKNVVAWMPLGIALVLVVAIFAYDGWLKETDVGPVSMGACRFLNVMLGLSIAGGAIERQHLLLAVVVGLYIVGVTLLAKTEARTSQRPVLQAAGAILLASLLLALPLPVAGLPNRNDDSTTALASPLFPFLLVAFGLFLGLAVWDAIQNPEPASVQAAVKRCLMGLIVFDAILASALAGTLGLLILLLMVPSVILNRRRRLYAT
jgi:4-hydroxybenzoate polyprenyltransferase